MIGIFFLTVIVIAVLFFRSDTETLVDPVVEVETEVVLQEEQDIVPLPTIVTKTGTTIATRDFLLDEDVVLIDEALEVYMIASEPGPDGTLYEIFYFKGGGGGITISLLNPDLAYIRNLAETDLQNKLDVSLLRLCALQISVTVPRSVSPNLTAEDYSGIDLGLPSCPGSIAL